MAYRMFSNLMLVWALLCSLVPFVIGSNDCAAISWTKRDVGALRCDYWAKTGPDVNYYTCIKLANKFKILVSDLFFLNPQLDKQCGNIAPDTDYCIFGGVVLPTAVDDKCGLPNNNATCIDTPKPCCNSETWTCGDTVADCAAGICFEGACPSAKQWSIDGKCGAQHNNVGCAGKWGDCCNNDGMCGTGPAFCEPVNCQSGNCSRARVDLPWATGNTTDGTCGGTSGMTCNVIWGNCCGKDGKCSSDVSICDAAQGCQPEFGMCSSTASK